MSTGTIGKFDLRKSVDHELPEKDLKYLIKSQRSYLHSTIKKALFFIGEIYAALLSKWD